jgi:hypothetical protein
VENEVLLRLARGEQVNGVAGVVVNGVLVIDEVVNIPSSIHEDAAHPRAHSESKSGEGRVA